MLRRGSVVFKADWCDVYTRLARPRYNIYFDLVLRKADIVAEIGRVRTLEVFESMLWLALSAKFRTAYLASDLSFFGTVRR